MQFSSLSPRIGQAVAPEPALWGCPSSFLAVPISRAWSWWHSDPRGICCWPYSEFSWTTQPWLSLLHSQRQLAGLAPIAHILYFFLIYINLLLCSTHVHDHQMNFTKNKRQKRHPGVLKMCIKTSVAPARLSFICFVGKHKFGILRVLIHRITTHQTKNKEKLSPGTSSRG